MISDLLIWEYLSLPKILSWFFFFKKLHHAGLMNMKPGDQPRDSGNDKTFQGCVCVSCPTIINRERPHTPKDCDDKHMSTLMHELSTGV